MHQSSLGTMMLLPATKLHPLWFTPLLPLLFLVSALLMGYAVVVLEATFSALAFDRPRETPMLASLSTVIMWVALFFVAFRLGEAALAGELGYLGTPLGIVFLVELGLHLAGALMLWTGAARARPRTQVRAAMLLLLGGMLFRIDTYWIAFTPGAHCLLLPGRAGDADHVRNRGPRDRAVHRRRENLPDPGQRAPARAGCAVGDRRHGTRITVDPVTRIEGHLRIDVEVDGGRVQNAWSSGQMFRGIERILKGRDPRDAWLFTQRFCGVCTTVHAITSVRAVENALKLEIPPNAQYIRNLIVAAHALHDHIVHFYHLSALDWVDVVSALKADPTKTSALAESLSDWPGNSRHQFKAVQDRLKGFVEAGQLGIFPNGYWGHPAMKLSPEVNLLAVSHYLQALEYQRKSNQVVAILGSKTPNIQNLAVGGVANAINLDNEATLNMQKLYMVKDLLDGMMAFIEKVYFVDVCAIGAMYADWFGYGKGVDNYLSVPDLPTDATATQFDLPGGMIINADLGGVQPITSWTDPEFKDNVSECIAHAWYDGDWTKHPYEEDTVPKYTKFDASGRYSWIKAPRFDGKVMQVGPLAQVLAGLGDQARGDDAVGDQDAADGRQDRGHDAHAGGPALDARPARGADDPLRGDRRAGVEALGSAGQQHRQGRRLDLQRARRSRRASSAASASTRRRAARSRTGS